MIKISLQSYGFRNGCHGLAGGRCLENNILAMHIWTRVAFWYIFLFAEQKMRGAFCMGLALLDCLIA